MEENKPPVIPIYKKKVFWILLAAGIIILGGLISWYIIARYNHSENSKNNSEATENEAQTDDQNQDSALTQCTQESYSADETSCESLPEDKICGLGRYIYDNGEEQEHGLEYRNPCSFCSFFDQNGFAELRGTKIYALGYYQGTCK